MNLHVLLVLLVVIILAPVQGRGDHKPRYCKYVRCATPLCANPAMPPGQCCPTCENSGCHFKGCVQFLEGQEVRWKPTGCITCTCFNNETKCAGVGCPIAINEDGSPFDPCPGVSKITKPDKCCPVCDFGLPEFKCNVIESNTQTFSLSSAGKTCPAVAQMHVCDKIGFLNKRGKRFRCVPVTRESRVELENCPPFTKVHYTDTVRCRAKRDNSLEVGCDILVP